MEKIAIIGTGIAGMGCGHFLHKKYDLTFYEELDYIGGHTNTITVNEDGATVHLDTGFMVFNYRTYPHLTQLFEQIKAPVKKTEMSFSVQYLPDQLEYSGSSLNHLFAQRRNIFKPSYLRMLLEINRFNTQCLQVLYNPQYADYTIGRYIREFGYGEDMLWKYLIPMSSAVWSAPMEQILDFPAVSLIRFFKNHGFLGLDSQHQWYTLHQGSQSYRELLIAPFKERIMLKQKVVKVERLENGQVMVTSSGGKESVYDKVIMACHADQSDKIVQHKTADEARLLSKFKYQSNKAVVHIDTSLMPNKKLAWSSWNYRVEQNGDALVPSTIYWMNQLQQVSDKKDYFVSINPSSQLDGSKVIKEIDYEHPLFDVPAMKAQEELHLLNQTGPVYYCGSYFKYGFHEDAYASAVELCKRL
ncbi:NAD(P)/FAD-dependent oxidoreductase [Pedobacter metabolipauper]|uniref:Putative NAD/FAD-binding protein n=1 Tax=Pedobacter metabolipauper TaxID=425513 RepID=A0A4R6SUP2_9SPHI|nr:FAD-dependent oxidoreductase [Pedobacter metabolipauper]TDQ08778.1 putative NAD/FAD-binding protein [Pedobacter metabolipauper]